MLGRPSARLSVGKVIAFPTVAGLLLYPKVRHHFGRATSATLFLTQAWNSSCLFGTRGTWTAHWFCVLRTLHLSFHLTTIVPYLHLHYSILFRICQEGFLIFLKSYHHCEEIRLLVISPSWLYSLYHTWLILSRGYFEFHLKKQGGFFLSAGTFFPLSAWLAIQENPPWFHRVVVWRLHHPIWRASEGFPLLFAFPWNNYIITNNIENVKGAFQISFWYFFNKSPGRLDWAYLSPSHM